MQITWITFGSLKIEFLQSAAFFEGSGVKARLRCQLIACLLWSPTCARTDVTFLEHPAPKISALWGRDRMEYITSTERAIFQADYYWVGERLTAYCSAARLPRQ